MIIKINNVTTNIINVPNFDRSSGGKNHTYQFLM